MFNFSTDQEITRLNEQLYEKFSIIRSTVDETLKPMRQKIKAAKMAEVDGTYRFVKPTTGKGMIAYYQPA